MMDMSLGEEDWALAYDWPPAGDQWQCSVDQYIEPFELIGNKSTEAEFGDHDFQSFNSTLWSDAGPCMCCIINFWTHTSLLCIMVTLNNLILESGSDYRPQSDCHFWLIAAKFDSR